MSSAWIVILLFGPRAYDAPTSDPFSRWNRQFTVVGSAPGFMTRTYSSNVPPVYPSAKYQSFERVLMPVELSPPRLESRVEYIARSTTMSWSEVTTAPVSALSIPGIESTAIVPLELGATWHEYGLGPVDVSNSALTVATLGLVFRTRMYSSK